MLGVQFRCPMHIGHGLTTLSAQQPERAHAATFFTTSIVDLTKTDEYLPCVVNDLSEEDNYGRDITT
jgi:hypothetical protein